MTTLGTLGEIMRQAGIKNPELAHKRLHNMARDCVRDGKNLDNLALAVAEDIEIVAFLCAPTLAQAQAEMCAGKGREQNADGRFGRTFPGAHAMKSPGAGAGRTGSTVPQPVGTRNRPGSHKLRDPAALRAVSATVAKSVLNSVRVRNGKAIGDCTPVELRELAGQNLREGFLCRLVLKTARLTPANDGQPLRQWCDKSTLQRCIQEAAAHQDLYVSAA